MGACIECGSKARTPKARFCNQCSNRHRSESAKNRWERLRKLSADELPMCPDCGERRVHVGYDRCKECQVPVVAARAAKRAARVAALPVDQRPRCRRCGTNPVVPGIALCDACETARKLEGDRRRRLSRKEQRFLENKELSKQGKRVCSRCPALKGFSEFSKTRGSGAELNDICDACLILLYKSRKWPAEMNAKYWRKLAYATNAGARIRINRYENRKLSISELEWKCSGEELAALFEKQKGRCVYCGRQLRIRDLTVDHRIPMSAEGKHSVDNIDIVCSLCQRMKWGDMPDDFRYQLYTFSKAVMTKWQSSGIKSPEGNSFF